ASAKRAGSKTVSRLAPVKSATARTSGNGTTKTGSKPATTSKPAATTKTTIVTAAAPKAGVKVSSKAPVAAKPAPKAAPAPVAAVSTKGAPTKVSTTKGTPIKSTPIKEAVTKTIPGKTTPTKTVATTAATMSGPAKTAPAKAPAPKAATTVEPKPAAPLECPKPNDITTITLATRYLMARPDFERLRSPKYGEQTFKLDRMRKLLELLGNPHQKIKTVHVAGTNGKGSTVSMISSMLRSAGYAVGTYTSPHLIDIRERVTIDGNQIGKTDFVEMTRTVAKAAEKLGEQATFFELMTAMAFAHFAEQAVDIAVVEVGLGGRLDSTNVITPLVSIVTAIDLDHTKLLGATKAQIAREKAGIFKKGVPALFFEQDPEVDAVMREVATQVGADL
ncbi:MAG: hypothetical protein EBU31_17270, partial [Proteobacteria bacterium]|nr:hypothetical protein [Pseudomonadota bacterium]